MWASLTSDNNALSPKDVAAKFHDLAVRLEASAVELAVFELALLPDSKPLMLALQAL